MSRYISIVTTTDSKQSAQALAAMLLKKKLVACAQIEMIESHYVWQENICNDQEYRISFKTKASHYEKVEEIIKKEHSYDTPEIIFYEINGGSKEYFEWIDEVVLS